MKSNSRAILLVAGVVVLLIGPTIVYAHQDNVPPPPSQWVDDWVQVSITNTRSIQMRGASIDFFDVTHPGHPHWPNGFPGTKQNLAPRNLDSAQVGTANLPSHMTRSTSPECTPATAFTISFKVSWTDNLGAHSRTVQGKVVPAGGAANGTVAGAFNWTATHQQRIDDDCSKTPEFAAVGGGIVPIDMAALLLAGTFANAHWILPTLAGIAGATIALTKLRRRGRT